ncbi:MAG: DUF3427 domain-containing protein [Mucispirillum sp.]|nr:DUF3427 domain-containing protein [Mucispirillum sp.]
MKNNNLPEGIYEELINKNLEELLNLHTEYISEKEDINHEESSLILSAYIGHLVRSGLQYIHKNDDKDKENINKKIEIINKIINILAENTDKEYISSIIPTPPQQLLSLYRKENNITLLNKKIKIERPITSLCQSSIFTGAKHEPQLINELKKEISTCHQIDMLVSFIKYSGLALMLDKLTEFTNNGGKLRIITTTYMKATDIKSIQTLSSLKNTEIKINYNIKSTRLHAKAYIFQRDTGFSTAYVGSSNISASAMTNGVEWNVKVTQKDMSDTYEKMKATFETYWNDKDFILYDESQEKELSISLDKNADKFNTFFMDIRPYGFQQEILEAIQADRKIRNNYKNLVIAATGTGKTVISAFDYKRFCKENPYTKCRLLFIVHRKEILEQSLATYRAILKDNNFGELFVDGIKPTQYDYLFASIQTFNSQDLTKYTTNDFYDYIVIDETHHASASTYQKLLTYYKPKILLGLTATPERADGKDIFKYFDNRISAEIRLPEAIERGLLCPFHYFGVSDSIDYSTITWERGKYKESELNNVLTINEVSAKVRINTIIQAINKYITDIQEIKGLGFCVSKEHAQYMSNQFNSNGISSIALTADSDSNLRSEARNKLKKGEYKFIFVVDIYNEGVDIPEVNTVLFLRPTESLTIFLQQLGRGLRNADNKEFLTVLDFIGQSNKKYNFEEKFNSLLHISRQKLENEINKGFVSLPKNCYITLEKKATEYILENIKGYFSKNNLHIERLKTFKADFGIESTLKNYLEKYNIESGSIYKSFSFNQLLFKAGLREEYHEPIYENAYKILGKISQINSFRFIDFIINILNNNINITNDLEKRMLQMFQFTIENSISKDITFNEILNNIKIFKENKILCSEIIELLEYNKSKIDFIDKQIDLGFECPLDVYCSYSKDQILVACDFFNVGGVREGVRYLEDKKLDLFFVTLNKSEKDYSPSTMYKDYSLNEKLFHWQSQSTTTETGEVGQRYIHHKETGNKILLFVREEKKNKYGITETYTFLGTANYISHEGSKPMSILWELDYPIPAKYIKETQKMVAI